MQYEVGQTYEVACAELCWREDKRTYFIPVLGEKHSDTQFGFPEFHYHIDGRFYLEPRMIRHFGLIQGCTASVIISAGTATYDFLSITYKKLLCAGAVTGLAIPDSPTDKQKVKLNLYHHWYESYVGRRCEGRKCPHLGTQMIEIGDVLICPLHNLKANAESLCIVRQ